MNTVHFDLTRATGDARHMVRTLVEANVFTLATSEETADHIVTVSVQDAFFADIYTNDYARGEFVALGPHAIINVRPHLSEFLCHRPTQASRGSSYYCNLLGLVKRRKAHHEDD